MKKLFLILCSLAVILGSCRNGITDPHEPPKEPVITAPAVPDLLLYRTGLYGKDLVPITTGISGYKDWTTGVDNMLFSYVIPNQIAFEKLVSQVSVLISKDLSLTIKIDEQGIVLYFYFIHYGDESQYQCILQYFPAGIPDTEIPAGYATLRFLNVEGDVE